MAKPWKWRKEVLSNTTMLALAGKKEEALSYLRQSVEAGWLNADHMKQDRDLLALHEEEEWKEIIRRVEERKQARDAQFDQKLKKQLESIYVRDQTLRRLYSDAEEKFGKGSEEMSYFWSVVSREDSINEAEVIDIIREHGWVGRSQVGGKANTALWLVIQHAPLEVQEKYLPLLEASVKEGESTGSHLALLQDRINMRNDEPQIYGSQVITDQETGEFKVYEIKNPAQVNERRKEVGLGPIEEYLKRWNIEWKVED